MDTVENEPQHNWAVTYLATASRTVIVQATGSYEAMDIADQEFESPSLCHQCSRNMDLSDWEIDSQSQWGVTDEGPIDS